MNIGNKKTTWPFWIQIPTLCFFGIVILWVMRTSFEPSLPNLNPDLLESAGVLGAFICFFGCVPIGITGCVFSRKKAGKMRSLRIPAKALSIINIVIGAAEISVVILILSSIIKNAGNIPR